MDKVMERQTTVVAAQKPVTVSRGWLIAASSFCFILLQSVCTAVMAVSGLRLIIGIGSLAAASTGIKLLDTIHGDAIRIPMVMLALAGSLVNLYVIWRIRSLRSRASSSWRVTAATPSKKRAETLQIVLSLATMVLIATEWVGHLRFFGRI